MTLNLHADGIPADQSERPADPRPAWERVANVWLAREVDAGRPVDPTALAAEVSVAPGFARDLVRVLRTERNRDPALGELPLWSLVTRVGLGWRSVVPVAGCPVRVGLACAAVTGDS